MFKKLKFVVGIRWLWDIFFSQYVDKRGEEGKIWIINIEHYKWCHYYRTITLSALELSI